MKYLGLLALNKLMAIAPKAVQEHKDTVLNCLDDEDITIRFRALDLVIGMVNKRNLMDIIKNLMTRIDTAEAKYRDELISKVISICSQGNYQFITDFEWYINVLVELTRVQGTTHGKRISDQLMDVCIRVKIIREFGAMSMVNLLHDTRLTAENPTENGICEVLYAASWIVGEFNSYVQHHCAIMDALLQPRITALPGHIQAVNIQNAMKLFSVVYAKGNGDLTTVAGPGEDSPAVALQIMKDRLPLFTKSADLETQERACFALQLINLVETTGAVICPEICALFAEPLNPVAEKAQRKVPVPPGLDLNRQINTPPPSDDESDLEDMDFKGDFDTPAVKDDPVARDAERKRRSQRKKQDPFYLGGDDDEDEDYPPVETLTGDMINMNLVGNTGTTMPQASKKRKQKVEVMVNEEMPEGALGDSSDEEQNDDNLFSGIDLKSAVRPDEELTGMQAYPLPTVGYTADQQVGSQEKPRKRKRREKRNRREESQNNNSSSAPSVTFAGETSNMKLAYELGVNPSQPDKVMVLFHIRALRSTLSNFEFDITCPMDIQLVQPADTNPSLTIAPKTHESHRLLFQFQSFIQPQKFNGTISFDANGKQDELEFEVKLPCSAFVQPVDITEDEFMQLSSNLSSNRSKIRCSDARKGLAAIGDSLHVKVVSITDMAHLYGRSTKGHHVCFFVKNQKGGFAIELKCSDSTFGSNLLSEVKSILKKVHQEE